MPPQPKLPRSVAEQLEAQSDDIARRLDAGDDCGALAAARTLQQNTISAINAGRVPGELQEPLASAASRVVTRISCTPAPTPPRATPIPFSEDTATVDGNQKHDKHDQHGKGDKHGKGADDDQ